MEDFILNHTPSLCKEPPVPELLVSVIVPAKNEEENIWQTLHALYHQTTPEGNALSKSVYEVIVLANNCEDHTATLARAFGTQHTDFNLHVAEVELLAPQAHIGFVRRLLMDEAYQRLASLDKPKGIIAATDSDTVVDSLWLYHIIQAIEQGADAVGGRILTYHEANCRERLYHLQDVTYRYLYAHLEALLDHDIHDPWPRHFQHFGPSLAVTCAMYDRVGRLPVLSSLEDVAFYEALQRFDSKIRHSPEVKVYTSSRKTGRVAFGFSVQLQQWAAMREAGKHIMVPDLSTCIYLITLRKRLRTCWFHLSQNLDEVYRLSAELGLASHELIDLITSNLYFGALHQHLMGMPSVQATLAQRFASVQIAEAIRKLRVFVNRHNPQGVCSYMATHLPFQKDPDDRMIPSDALSA